MADLKNKNLLITRYNSHCVRLGISPKKVFTNSIALVENLATRPQFSAFVAQGKTFQKQDIKVNFVSKDLSFTVNFQQSKKTKTITGRIFSNIQGNPAIAIDFEKSEYLYGLGAAAFTFNHNQTKAKLLNIDTVFYRSEGLSYSTFPFLWKISPNQIVAVFVHSPLPMNFEAGTSEALFLFEKFSENDDIDLFFFAGSPAEISQAYAEITGYPFLPPIWALGYHQSRWSYKTQKKVIEIGQKMRQYGIPCDAIYLDIHYMQDYKVFTFHKKNFSEIEKMTAQLKEMGIETVAIVDPGVKVENGYAVYEQGLMADVFCKQKNGNIYVGKVWPGNSVFPDFSREDVRHFWADWHRVLFEKGIRGIWNDMNDPVLQIGKDYDPLNEDIWHGQLPHYAIRNLYANYEAMATYEAFLKYLPNERPFILTRSAFSGIQRYSALWTGDNHSSWEHLRLNLAHVINLSLAGVPFCGADVGGFGGGPGLRGIFKIRKDKELMARWLQLGYLMPFFRMHTVLYSYAQEPWSFGEEVLQIARKYIRRRYRFLPYLYHLFVKAAKTGEPIIRPIFYEFPEVIKNEENLYLVGPNLLAAAIWQKGQQNMEINLPPGEWINYETGENYTGTKTYEVPAPINSHPLFVKKGTALPTAEPMKNTQETLNHSLIWEIYPGETIYGEYYYDDGISYPVEKWYQMEIKGKQKGNTIDLEIREKIQGIKPPFEKIFLRIVGDYEANIQGKKQNARIIGLQGDGRNLRVSEFMLPRKTQKIQLKNLKEK